MVGLDLDGSPEFRDGLRQAVLTGKDNAQLRQRIDVIGGQREDTLKAFGGFIQPVQGHARKAEMVPGADMIGIRFDRLAVETFGVGKTLSLVMFLSFGKEIGCASHRRMNSGTWVQLQTRTPSTSCYRRQRRPDKQAPLRGILHLTARSCGNLLRAHACVGCIVAACFISDKW
jgi:hypothetical protein